MRGGCRRDWGGVVGRGVSGFAAGTPHRNPPCPPIAVVVSLVDGVARFAAFARVVSAAPFARVRVGVAGGGVGEGACKGKEIRAFTHQSPFPAWQTVCVGGVGEWDLHPKPFPPFLVRPRILAAPPPTPPPPLVSATRLLRDTPLFLTVISYDHTVASFTPTLVRPGATICVVIPLPGSGVTELGRAEAVMGTRW